MRAANEIDFWRGLALVSIFVNHIPGFAFERITHRNYGLSDSAELFVFLAGWSLRRLADKNSDGNLSWRASCCASAPGLHALCGPDPDHHDCDRSDRGLRIAAR